MKLKFSAKEQLAFFGVLVVAFAIPISLLDVYRSQETRSEAASKTYIIADACILSVYDPSANEVCLTSINAAFQLVDNGDVIKIHSAYDGLGVIDGTSLSKNSNLSDGDTFTITSEGSENVTWTNSKGTSENALLLEIKDLTKNLTLNIKNINFIGNANSCNKDLIRVEGVTSNLNVNFYNVVVRDNNYPSNSDSCKGAMGIYIGGDAVVNVINSTFENNYTNSIYSCDSSDLTVLNSTFRNNVHRAITVEGTANAFISKSYFEGNNIENSSGRSAVMFDGDSTGKVVNSYFYKNHYWGGIFLVSGGNVSVENNIFKQNDYDGINLGEPYSSKDSCAGSFVIVNNTFIENKTTGINFNTKFTGSIKIFNNIFKDNGLYDDPTIKDCDFEANIKLDGNVELIDLKNNSFTTDGTKGGVNYTYGCNVFNLKEEWNSIVTDDPHLLSNYQHEWMTSDQTLLEVSRPWVDYSVNVDTGVGLDPLSSLVINKGHMSDYNCASTNCIPDANPDGQKMDLGAWGGRYADWEPVGSITNKTADVCTAGIKVNIKDYNDPYYVYKGALGKLVVTENGYSDKDHAGQPYYALDYFQVDDSGNATITIPKELKDGKNHVVRLVAYNIYYTDTLSRFGPFARSDMNLGVAMSNQKDTITINCSAPTPPVNHAPVFDTELDDKTAYIEKPFTYSFSASDPDGDVVNSSVTIPADLSWLTFDQSKNIFSGTPPKGSKTGEHEVKVKITDAKGLTAEKSFTIVVDYMTGDYSLVHLKIDLQVKDDNSNSAVALDFINASGTSVYKGTEASDKDGNIAALEMISVDTGTYTVWIKPKGYLAKKVTANIVNGINTIVVEDKFLAGDLESNITDNVIKAADYAVLVSKYFQEDCDLRNLDGICMVNIKDVTVMYSNWFKQGDSN